MFRLILILFVCAVATAAERNVSPGTLYGSGAPAGACSTGRFYVDTASSTLYNCVAGVWTSVGGSGSAAAYAYTVGVCTAGVAGWPGNLPASNAPTATGCANNKPVLQFTSGQNAEYWWREYPVPSGVTNAVYQFTGHFRSADTTHSLAIAYSWECLAPGSSYDNPAFNDGTGTWTVGTLASTSTESTVTVTTTCDAGQSAAIKFLPNLTSFSSAVDWLDLGTPLSGVQGPAGADGADGVDGVDGAISPYYINVKDGGVLGDGVTITDVTTTSGSAIVTRASGSWVAGDVGKMFSCYGAGTSGANLNTTILSRQSNTQVTLAANAGTSIAGTATCTYASDDASAIQSLATANRPGVLFFPKGTYGIGSAISWFSQLSAIGAGAGKSIIVAMGTYSDNMTAAMFNATGSAGTPITDVQIAGLEMHAKYANQATYNIAGKAVAIIHMLRANVHDNYFHDFPATCFGPDEMVDSQIYNNVIERCGLKNDGTQGGGNGIGFSLLDDTNEGGAIYGNIVRDVRRYGIMIEAGAGVNRTARWNMIGNVVSNTSGFTMSGGILDGGSTGSMIVGNRLYGPTDAANVWGIVVNKSSTGTTPGVNTLIADNQITGFDSCISVDHTTTAPSVTPHNYKVSGNKCTSPRSEGIRFVSHGSTGMVGVEATNNHVYGAGNAGIEFSGAAGFTNVVTSNNTLIGNGVTTANGWEAAGIAANSSITRWVAKGNTAYDAGSSKQLYGIGVNTGKTVSVDFASNNFDGNVTGEYLTTGATLTGPIVSVADAAARPCEVHISGTDTGGVLKSGDDTIAAAACVNNFARTLKITAVQCWTDAGASLTINPVINGGSALLTGALTCGAGFGNIATSTSFSVSTQTAGQALGLGMGGTLSSSHDLHVIFKRSF